MNAVRHQVNGTERDVLASLQRQYEAAGFSFEIEPGPQDTPDFLRPYVPDAIARKSGENVAIEVKSSQSRSNEIKLQRIRSRFDEHPDWTFSVVYIAEDPLNALLIRAVAASKIRHQLAEIHILKDQGHIRAAFLLAWTLLEATLLNIEGGQEARPRGPASVLQELAMLGRIAPETERRIRPMIHLRNAVVHGDLAKEPTTRDVETIASVVEEALSSV